MSDHKLERIHLLPRLWTAPANPVTITELTLLLRTENHLPPYIQAYDQFKSKGVDAVYCLASNDVFVSTSDRSPNTIDRG